MPNQIVRTETEKVWAQFRLLHPELYADAVKQSPDWPYLAGKEAVRVA